MTRKEIYAKIKELNLSEEVKKQFGDNYTRVPSDKLEALINAANKKVLPSQKIEKIVEKHASKNGFNKKYEAALFYLSSLLLSKKVITRTEADQLADYLKH